MHEERFALSAETADALRETKKAGHRIVAAGTTTLRVLESATQAGEGRTRLFIHPPYEFKTVDALVTNFHLPRSTLLMLAAAFAAPGETRGRDLILRAYEEAVAICVTVFSATATRCSCSYEAGSACSASRAISHKASDKRFK
jgi:S-adenosylmethionine:tRNA ribosyltransferase-isomerase